MCKQKFSESERRLCKVQIHGALLTELITEGWHSGGDEGTVRCVRGLPEGAAFMFSVFDYRYDTVDLVYHHESFELVGPRDPIPIMYVEYEREHRPQTETEEAE